MLVEECVGGGMGVCVSLDVGECVCVYACVCACMRPCARAYIHAYIPFNVNVRM